MNGTSSSTSNPITTPTSFLTADIHVQTLGAGSARYVVVRYFLDRPGYGLDNSSSRIWKDPPIVCSVSDIRQFLYTQGILHATKGHDHPTLLCEVYLDHFRTYILLEVAENDGIRFDFQKATCQQPGVLNIRLTDVEAAGVHIPPAAAAATTSAISAASQFCNTSPAGLFAFSMTMWLEAVQIFGQLVEGTVDPSFVLVRGPYAFFVSGLVQLLVGLIEAKRNNIFGCTAFLLFGAIWLANGTRMIITNYFPAEIDPDLLDDDSTGVLLLTLWQLALVLCLLYQTFAMGQLNTILLSLLSVKLICASVTGYSRVMEWFDLIMTALVACMAFYLFAAEFTNEVYHQQVFNLYPWKSANKADGSSFVSDEVWGTPGRVNKLQIRSVQLRAAHSQALSHDQNQSSAMKGAVLQVRAVQPPVKEE
jgi:uncharacterized protein